MCPKKYKRNIKIIKDYFEIKKKFNEKNSVTSVIFNDSLNNLKFLAFIDQYAKSKKKNKLTEFKKIEDLLEILK